MNEYELLETVLLGINMFQVYRACSMGRRCGVALAILFLNVFVYVGSRVGVDRSVVALAVAFALLVALVVVSG
jgi:hypothetical protein